MQKDQGNASMPKRQPPAYDILQYANDLQSKMNDLSCRMGKVLEPIMMPDNIVKEQINKIDGLMSPYPPYFAELRQIFHRINDQISNMNDFLTRAEME